MDTMEGKARELADMLKMLANENRLLILCHLTERSMNVTELHEHVPQITQPALSQHLSLLKAHRILDCNKCGQSAIYYLKDEKMLEVMHTLKQIYCGTPQ